MSRMDILIARPYTTRDGEQKTAFTKVGTAWPMQGREGYTLTFDALPIPTMNDKGVIETRVLMMPPKQDGDAPAPRSGGGYSRDKASRQAPAFDGGDGDTVPF